MQQTAPIPFGTDGDECTAAQKNNLRVTIRLLAYVRSRLTKETITNMTALMWDDIARHTDELLLVAETFQPTFQHAIQVLFASRLADEIFFEPIADPVRYGKHACMMSLCVYCPDHPPCSRLLPFLGLQPARKGLQ